MSFLKTLNLFSGGTTSTIAKVVLLNALIVGAAFTIVYFTGVEDSGDISVYKSSEFYKITDDLVVDGRSYWVSNKVDVGYVYNQSSDLDQSGDPVGENFTVTYFLTRFDGQSIEMLPFLESRSGVRYYSDFRSWDLARNGSSTFRFEFAGYGGGFVYLTVYETHYLLFPQGSPVETGNTLNGYPSVMTHSTYIMKFRVSEKLQFDSAFALDGPGMSISPYNDSSQLILINRQNQTEVYIAGLIDFLNSHQDMEAIVPTWNTSYSNPVHIVNASTYVESLETRYVVMMTGVEVKLVDSLGRVHMTGRGTQQDETEGTWVGLNRPDYVMLDPVDNVTYYWQLLPYSGRDPTMEFVDLGDKVMVVFDYFKVSGYFENQSFFTESPDYNQTIQIEFMSHYAVQFSVFDPENPTVENYVQFNQTLSKKPEHTITFPRLSEVSTLEYTTNSVGTPSFRRFSVIGQPGVNSSRVTMAISLYKTDRGAVGDINGCESSHGKVVIRQVVNVVDSGTVVDPPEETFGDIEYSNCDDDFPVTEKGWTVNQLMGLIALDADDVYVVVTTTHYLGRGDSTYYSTYIYRF